MAASSHKKIILVGGGHAHLYTLARLNELVALGASVTVITARRYHYYSGMGPGLLAGTYPPDTVRFDIPELVHQGGGSCVIDSAIGIDPARQLVMLAASPPLPYDLISCNCGSEASRFEVPLPATVLPAKPFENLLTFRDRALQHLNSGIPRFIVAGGGAAGVELAGNLERLVRQAGGRAFVTLVAGKQILERFPAKAALVARESLEDRKVQVVTGKRVAAWKDGTARLDDGSELPYDLALVATGVSPSPLFRNAGLPVAEDGSLLVDDHLQCVAHPEILGGGDCVSLAGRQLDRVGVYAVRQAPVIFANLKALLTGKNPNRFTPQSRYLQLLNLGDGTALFIRGSTVYHGKSALFLKDYLDSSFMKTYQNR